MIKRIIIAICTLVLISGCRRNEDDVKQFFYTNEDKFNNLVKASLSRKLSSSALENQLGVYRVTLDNTHCDTIQNYDEVRLQMQNNVYVDNLGWGCNYYYIYSVCPQDSFYHQSNNVTSVWLAPHWHYFIEKGL